MRLPHGKERVLVIPDLQAPFHHKDALAFLKEVAKEVKPTKIVCIGDSIDAYALGSYVRSPEAMGADQEIKKALNFLHKGLYKLFPNAVEVDSNHNNRVFRRAYEAGIPKRFLKSYAEFLQSPWEFKQSVEIDGVLYEHGEPYGGIAPQKMAALSNMQSTVIGHHHTTAGIQYVSTKTRMLFGMNVGCLIDNETYAFEYNKKYKFHPTLSCGAVLYGTPVLFPMKTKANRRWTGSL